MRELGVDCEKVRSSGGGYGGFSDWGTWLENSEIGPVASVGTRLASADKREPDLKTTEEKTCNALKSDCYLNKFSQTGFLLQRRTQSFLADLQ